MTTPIEHVKVINSPGVLTVAIGVLVGNILTGSLLFIFYLIVEANRLYG
jgi:hypothetical protein